MSELVKEAIVLMGGMAWRLKPDVWCPKPQLPFGVHTLLDYQLKWLISNGFEHIILASDKEYECDMGFSDYVEWSVEEYPRGTGGAVMSAVDKLDGNVFYLMNVDDICLYKPTAMTFPVTQARLLVAKPRMNFGKVELRQDIVIGFKEKPYVDYYVSAGHYLFKKHIVDKYFPDNGNLEDTVLPTLARERILENHRLQGKWVSINTYKDYNDAKYLLGID